MAHSLCSRAHRLAKGIEPGLRLFPKSHEEHPFRRNLALGVEEHGLIRLPLKLPATHKLAQGTCERTIHLCRFVLPGWLSLETREHEHLGRLRLHPPSAHFDVLQSHGIILSTEFGLGSVRRSAFSVEVMAPGLHARHVGVPDVLVELHLEPHL